jgi:hypothetical protein
MNLSSVHDLEKAIARRKIGVAPCYGSTHPKICVQSRASDVHYAWGEPQRSWGLPVYSIAPPIAVAALGAVFCYKHNFMR